MRAGDLLFVPGGTPHCVENLEDTLAVAGNFVDDSNYEAALRDMRVLGLRAAAVAATAAALDEIEFDPEEGMLEGCLPAEQLVFEADV